MNCRGKKCYFERKYCFKSNLKFERESEVTTLAGKLFHTFGVLSKNEFIHSEDLKLCFGEICKGCDLKATFFKRKEFFKVNIIEIIN